MSNLKYELKGGKTLEYIPIFCVLRIIFGIIVFSLRYGRLYFSFVSVGASVTGESLSLATAWLIVLIVMIYGASSRSEAAVAISVAVTAFLCFYGAFKALLITLYDKSEISVSVFAIISCAVMILPSVLQILFMTGRGIGIKAVKYISFAVLAVVSVYALIFVILSAISGTVNLSLPLSQVSLSVILAFVSTQISTTVHYNASGNNTSGDNTSGGSNGNGE